MPMSEEEKMAITKYAIDMRCLKRSSLAALEKEILQHGIENASHALLAIPTSGCNILQVLHINANSRRHLLKGSGNGIG